MRLPATLLPDTVPAPAKLAAWRPSPSARLGGEDAVGHAVAAAWADAGGPPAVAVMTEFSVLEGGCPPGAWTAALAGPILLADRGDLLCLPAALKAWGSRLVVGASLSLAPPGAATDHDGYDVVLVVASPAGYTALCRLLTARHRDASWPWGWCQTPDLGGLVALVRDTEIGTACARAGATVQWRLDIDDTAGPTPWPAVLLPRCGFVHADDARLTAPLLAELRDVPRAPGRALEDLIPARARWRGHEALVEAGRALLAACAIPPPTAMQMPPSLHAQPTVELRRRAEAGAIARYGTPLPPAVRARLEHELGVIQLKGFCSYILTVADLAAGRRTCGRGSAASSLVVFCLGITAVDPVRWNLLFERFLSPSRMDPPDIDVDFPWDERDAVLTAALRTYGSDRVAMVATHLHLKRWSALRLVARRRRRDPTAVGRIQHAIRARERYGHTPSLSGWEDDLGDAARIVGMPHHIGLHCGGIIITPGPLADLVPVHPARKHVPDPDSDPEAGDPPGVPMPTIAWEKDGAEAMGLIKIDLLGNRSLAVVRDALADLAADGIRIDEHRWRPADDPATRQLLAAGLTMGCFYVESPAMRLLQARSGVGDFDHLVIHSSIIRPAANQWIQTYLERLHQHRATGVVDPAWYAHPILRELLSETYGILSYQEDVLLVAMRLAGFDDRQANGLRKALGHFDTGSRLTRFAEDFRAGCLAQGVDAAVAEKVWTMISSFSGYSFAKAHSASYAMVSMQCAWLKAHYPAYFLARVVANEGGFYHPAAYLAEARRLGVRTLRPCVVHSAWRTCRADAGAIRCGLHLVPGLGPEVAARLIAARVERPFAGLSDLRRRSGCAGSVLITLADVGALDALRPDLTAAQVRWVAAAVADQPTTRRPARVAEAELWCADPAPAIDPVPPDDLPNATPREAAWRRYTALGFLPEAHPIWFVKRPQRRTTCASITPAWAGRRVALTAWPLTRREVDAHPRGGGQVQPMSFVTLEDDTGLLETVWFPDTYRRCGVLLDTDQPLHVHGRVAVEFGVVTLEVEAARGMGHLLGDGHGPG